MGVISGGLNKDVVAVSASPPPTTRPAAPSPCLIRQVWGERGTLLNEGQLGQSAEQMGAQYLTRLQWLFLPRGPCKNFLYRDTRG